MVKINGYWYNYDEIIEALRKKGYTIIGEYELDKRGDAKNDWYAIKDGETPSPLNTMESVALNEFHKKPPLI